MKRIRRRGAVLPALWVVLAAFMSLCRVSGGFSRRWMEQAALPALGALHRLSAAAPFPLLEPLAFGAAVLAGAALVMAVAGGLRRGLAPARRRLKGALWLMLIVGAGYAALWYPAYWAAPVEPLPAPDVGRLEWLCGALIDGLNAAELDFPAPGEALHAAPEIAGMPGSVVKAVRYPEWMRAAGVAGLFSPWTGEVMVDSGAPVALVPFTAVHELMHLEGVADEGAANIAAWRRCRSAGGAFFDSARLWALRYAMGMLRQADETAWRSMENHMNGALRRAFVGVNGEAVVRKSPLPAALGLSRPAASYAELASWLIAAGAL